MSSNKYSIDADIFNIALKMASEFGEDFLQPIQARLAILFPDMMNEQLDLYNKKSGKARDEAYKFVYHQMSDLAAKSETISKSWSFAQFEVHMKAKYPLINEENLSHLYSQGCYFAYKDGIITPLEND